MQQERELILAEAKFTLTEFLKSQGNKSTSFMGNKTWTFTETELAEVADTMVEKLHKVLEQNQKSMGIWHWIKKSLVP